MKILKLLPLIGIAILIYIVYKVGLTNLYNTVLTANLFYVTIALIILPLTTVLLAFKWWVILKFQNINISYKYAFKLYLIGMFYGAITPSKAGSVIRASYLKEKTQKPFGECVSSIVLERILDLFSLFILSIIGIFVFSSYISNLFLPFMVTFGVFALLSLFLLKKSLNRYFMIFIYNFLIPGKLKEKSKEIYDAFYNNLLNFKKLIIIFVITFITWILISTYAYYIALAYSINISFFHFVLIGAISTVVSLIPITVGGIGTRELTMVGLFSFFGIPAVKVISLSVLILLFGNFLMPFTGFLISLKEPYPEKLL